MPAPRLITEGPRSKDLGVLVESMLGEYPSPDDDQGNESDTKAEIANAIDAATHDAVADFCQFALREELRESRKVAERLIRHAASRCA
jgi:hypothetical protein